MSLAPQPLVIDLGVPDDLERLLEHGPRGRRSGIAVRVTAAALVALACLGLTGATAPAPERLRFLRDLPGTWQSALTVAGDTAYLVNTGPTARTVSAYDLLTGAVQWTVPADQAVRSLSTTPDPGVLLAHTAAHTTVALDTASGARRWTAAGDLEWAGAAHAVLSEYRDGSPAGLRVVSLATGTPAWSLSFTGPHDWYPVGGSNPRIVDIAADGAATTYRITDGAVTARGRVDAAPGQPLSVHIDPAAGGLYLSRQAGGRTTVSAYRLDTLAPLWRTSHDGWATVRPDCGRLLCLRTDTGFSGVDPGTGELRWSTRWNGSADSLGPDRLVAYDGGDVPVWVLVDAITGVDVQVLGAGQWASGSADLLVRDTPAAGPALVRVDPRTGHQRPLGVLPDATPRGCWAQKGYLFCPRSLEKIGVWAVRG